MSDTRQHGPRFPRADPYIIHARLGGGGQAEVYEGEDPALGRRVAIKVLKDTGDPEDAARFLREARTIARLSHPNIIQVYHCGETGSEPPRPFFVMERMDRSLADEIAGRPLAFEEARVWMLQILDALDCIHYDKHVHRDVKPANCLLKRSESAQGGFRLRLGDFGIVRTVDAEHTTLTAPGAAIGTLSYMSPEQLRGLASVDHRSDLYAAGIMLFRLLTGHLPYVGGPGVVVARHLDTEDPPRLAEAAPELKFGAELEDIIRTALAKDPARRYQSAGEFRRALVAAHSDALPTSPTLSGARAAPTSTVGRPWLVGACLVACVLLAFAVADQVRSASPNAASASSAPEPTRAHDEPSGELAEPSAPPVPPMDDVSEEPRDEDNEVLPPMGPALPLPSGLPDHILPDDISAKLRSRRKPIEQCHVADGWGRTLTVQLTVKPDGGMRRTALTSSQKDRAHADNLQACVERALRRIEFPESRFGGQGRHEFTFD